jgi:O-antigen ligase
VHTTRGAGVTRSRANTANNIAFWTFALQLWSIGGLALSNAFMGVSAIAALWDRAALRRPLAPRRLALPFVAFLLIFLVSTAFSYEPRTSVGRFGELLGWLPLVLALAIVTTESRARKVVRGLMVMGALLAAFGLVQIAAGDAGVELGRRAAGPFSHYQTFAGVLLLCGTLSFVRLVCGGPGGQAAGGSKRGELAAAIAGTLLPAFALSLNLTRGSWVALAATVLFVLAVRRPRHLLWLVPASVVALLVMPPAVRERAASIFDLRDESNYDRLCMLDAGLHMISERPVFGLGPGVVESRYPLYRHPTAPRDHRPHLHNTYLQLAAEYGVLALIAFIAILLASMRQTLLNYRREGSGPGPRADLHLGVAAALVAYTLAAFFEDNWADTEVQKIALFIIALPFCLDSRADR